MRARRSAAAPALGRRCAAAQMFVRVSPCAGDRCIESAERPCVRTARDRSWCSRRRSAGKAELVNTGKHAFALTALRTQLI